MHFPIAHVFWIFGLSGAGKSTLATALIEKLRDEKIPVLALDGDNLRTGLCRGLGFSDIDRTENLRRAGEVARLATASGLCVVASFITPQESQRCLIQEIVGPDQISLIFANAPLDICRKRDVKGLYARAQAGKVQQMTGVNSTFEIPMKCDFNLPTSMLSPTDSLRLLVQYVQGKLTTIGPAKDKSICR